MEATTKITTLFDDDAQDLMTVSEYPIYPKDSLFMSKEEAKRLLNTFSELKLNRYFDCIQKAKIVAEYLGVDHIHLGSLMVESTEEGVSYGYYYNPPLELHAWVQTGAEIIDFSLAGTIEKGLKTKDEIGYFLVDREPVILAGIAPSWARYITHEVVRLDNVNVLSKKIAKELLNGNKSIRF